METFTIDQLRADVVRNFEDQIDSKTIIRLQTTRHSSGDIQYDVLIDFMIAALIGNMNKFTLNQLCDDVVAHTDLSHAEILNGYLKKKQPFWKDQWSNWMLMQMIGRSEYNFLLANPDTVVEFIPVTQDRQIVLRIS